MISVKKYGLKIYHFGSDKIPPGVEYVGRPTTFVNPWSHVKGKSLHKTKTAAESVKKYIEYAAGNTAIGKLARRHLRGKDLSCDCGGKSEKECHASVVMELANEPEGERK